MNKIIALNICLLPSEQIKKFLQENYSYEKSEYACEDLEYFPHLSLEMLFIQENKVDDLYQELKLLVSSKIFLNNSRNIRKWNLYWISVQRTEELNKLQKRIIELVQKYKENWKEDSFITEKFQYENNVDWVKNYEKNNNFSSDLHITSWQQEPQKLDINSLETMLEFPELVLWHMWNFCAVRRIINKIQLK